jgi:hypothetical protein
MLQWKCNITHCYTTGTVTLLWKCNMMHRSCYQGIPNMSHCPLLKTARPEQSTVTAPVCPYELLSIFDLRCHWTWRASLSIRAIFGDFPLSGRAVRPHAITFSDSCPIATMVLASFHLVPGELSFP